MNHDPMRLFPFDRSELIEIIWQAEGERDAAIQDRDRWHLAAFESQANASARRIAEADRDALARKIAAAPHDWFNCLTLGDPYGEPTGKCTCWKADTGDAAHQGQDEAKGGEDE